MYLVTFMDNSGHTVEILQESRSISHNKLYFMLVDYLDGKIIILKSKYELLSVIEFW